MANLTIDIDLPEHTTITGYHRLPDAHGIEVAWPLPESCCCPRCKTVEPARIETNLDVGKTRVVRDLDIFGQPAFFCYQAVFHRCPKCHHRHDLLPPFKRKDTSYTYRFEKQVLRMLIGSNEAEVARRLGISAETVRFIVKNQLADGQALVIDPKRVITDIGMDEISLKKRHKLYVTIMTDLSDPQNPQVLAVMPGRDEKAAAACLNLLTPEQRAGVVRYRVDMGASYNKACGDLLKNAKASIDRFHVAKLFGEAVDGVRKKITRGYKKKLTKAERKEFRSRMWEFRRDPSSLSAEEKAKLEALFEKLPELRTLYELRVEFKRIFDETQDRKEAELALTAWIVKLLEAFPEMDNAFVKTYERWQEEILNYFDGRHTSGVVEGINNKARVITKRAYGLKSASSLWTRLVLDLNLAAEAVGQTIESLRTIVSAFRPVFSAACT
jgi:transposase